MYDSSLTGNAATAYSASCNTGLRLFTDPNKGYGSALPFTFFGSTDKIWLTSTFTTSTWAWCAYCIRSANEGHATETHVGQFIPGTWTPQ